MPELNSLTCSIDLGVTNVPLREYTVTYGNKRVSCHVCVPDYGTPFSISLNSSGYIAPGLAAFVYIDGQYQANRNKTGLALPSGLPSRQASEVSFRFRQKEELQSDASTLIGRAWTFSPIKTVSTSDTTILNREFVENIGTIEVIVLRCRGRGSNDGRLSGHMIDIPDELLARRKALVIANEGHPSSLVSKTRHPSPYHDQELDMPESIARLYDGSSDHPLGNIAPAPLQDNKYYWDNWTAGHRGYGPLPYETLQPVHDPFVEPEYTISPVDASIAKARGCEAHVKTGRGARYRHHIGRPDYLDTMKSPYAAFTFNYRTARVLGKMLGEKVVPDKENTIKKLKGTSRAELERELLECRIALESKNCDETATDKADSSKNIKAYGDRTRNTETKNMPGAWNVPPASWEAGVVSGNGSSGRTAKARTPSARTASVETPSIMAPRSKTASVKAPSTTRSKIPSRAGSSRDQQDRHNQDWARWSEKPSSTHSKGTKQWSVKGDASNEDWAGVGMGAGEWDPKPAEHNNLPASTEVQW